MSTYGLGVAVPSVAALFAVVGLGAQAEHLDHQVNTPTLQAVLACGVLGTLAVGWARWLGGEAVAGDDEVRKACRKQVREDLVRVLGALEQSPPDVSQGLSEVRRLVLARE